MTVSEPITTFRLQRQSIGTDFAFPLGQWEAVGIALGDATGGEVGMVKTFDRHYIYSFEGAAVIREDSSSDFARIVWQPQNGGGTAWSFGLDMFLVGIVQRSAINHTQLFLPLSATDHQADVTAQAGVGINSPLVVYRCNLWGYFWDKRAVLTRSGPVRPK